MSFPVLASPPFFFATPDRPLLTRKHWDRMLKEYLAASGPAEFTPARRRAFLLHCLETDKSAVATSGEYNTTLEELWHHFSTSCYIFV
ncbi:hypothetical protein HPB51_028893 [Rhipicephalus microplus]|uniref:Uncharacterized protein n=1 Tax=Rhipicephalus microplus TaxID=6941 RepID=A0A9J6CWL1_RHIMP|nr:hypothetical protein HPB51_028893 [Rhipicephalus microplus]